MIYLLENAVWKDLEEKQFQHEIKRVQIVAEFIPKKKIGIEYLNIWLDRITAGTQWKMCTQKGAWYGMCTMTWAKDALGGSCHKYAQKGNKNTLQIKGIL